MGAATTENYSLSLHDALPISSDVQEVSGEPRVREVARMLGDPDLEAALKHARTLLKTARETPESRSGTSSPRGPRRSEEHTSELQSQFHVVCRPLLEKKTRTP